MEFDRLVDLEMEADFIGKEALRRIRDAGATRKLVGLHLDGDRLSGPNTTFWSVSRSGRAIGKVTSAVYSPRLEKNIALAMISADEAALGRVVDVDTPSGPRTGTIVEKPFHDPKKSLAKVA